MGSNPGPHDDIFNPEHHGHSHGHTLHQSSYSHHSSQPHRIGHAPIPQYGAPQYIHHGGANGTGTYAQDFDEDDDPLERAEEPTSNVLRDEEVSSHAVDNLVRATDPATGDPVTFDTVITLSFEMALSRDLAGTKFTIAPEDLRKAIADNMTKSNAYWVDAFPRHLLEHAFPRDHRVTLIDSPHRLTSAASGHSLLLLSNVDTLNGKRHYSHRWHQLTKRSTNVMLVHSGHEARSCAESRNETYYHLDPLHCDYAYKAHSTSVFHVRSIPPIDPKDSYYIFRRGSIYDRHLRDIMSRMDRRSATRPLLEAYYRDALQAKKARGLEITPEIAHLNLKEFRIIDELSFNKYITPAIMGESRGPPLAMFKEGLSFYLTTDKSSPEAIERWVRDGAPDELSSAQSDHSVLIEVDLALIFPLLPPSSGSAYDQ